MNKKTEVLQDCLEGTTALLRSMETIVNDRPNDPWRFNGYLVYMRKYMDMITKIQTVAKIDAPIDTFHIEKIPSIANTMGIQQEEFFQMAHANLSILKAWLERRTNTPAKEANSLIYFLENKLRSVVFDAPRREIDVQNDIERLLVGKGLTKGVDYDRETGRVKISVKECIPDFIFPNYSLALEVKLSKDKARLGSIVDEINADILSYSNGYENIHFLVYDCGIIRDEVEFKRDLETLEHVTVSIIKH